MCLPLLLLPLLPTHGRGSASRGRSRPRSRRPAPRPEAVRASRPVAPGSPGREARP